ncbi:MAG: hypothetical protein IJ949_07055, partial [Oscillospiraceae bacterium]|nr:hypothetical protein [Oscillospiraceae bacterium]
MSKKFTKRALSLLIALALTISLLPSVVFATGESVVYDFNETTVTSVKNGTAAVSPSGWTLASGTNWSIDAEKTTDIKTAATYTEFITQQMYVNASDATKKYYGWLDATTDADVKKMQFAINAELSDAGWYDIEFVGCPAVQSGYTYLYFDGQYAGDYDFLDATVSPVSKAIRVSKKLNSLYLTPENGLVNIMLAKADGYYRVIDNKDVRVTNINPSQIKLTKRDEAPAVSSLNVWCNDENETPIEDAMIIRMDNAGEFAFSVKALMDNEEPLYFNGYSDDRTEVASGNPFSVIVENESVVSYSLVKNADDGIMSGKLTAINGGKTTVTIKVDVGGNAKELSFDVVVDAPIKLEFNSTTLEDTDSSKSGVQGKTLGTKDGVNYEVVTSKSTDQNVG